MASTSSFGTMQDGSAISDTRKWAQELFPIEPETARRVQVRVTSAVVFKITSIVFGRNKIIG